MHHWTSIYWEVFQVCDSLRTFSAWYIMYSCLNGVSGGWILSAQVTQYLVISLFGCSNSWLHLLGIPHVASILPKGGVDGPADTAIAAPTFEAEGNAVPLLKINDYAPVQAHACTHAPPHTITHALHSNAGSLFKVLCHSCYTLSGLPL